VIQKPVSPCECETCRTSVRENNALGTNQDRFAFCFSARFFKVAVILRFSAVTAVAVFACPLKFSLDRSSFVVFMYCAPAMISPFISFRLRRVNRLTILKMPCSPAYADLRCVFALFERNSVKLAAGMLIDRTHSAWASKLPTTLSRSTVLSKLISCNDASICWTRPSLPKGSSRRSKSIAKPALS